MKIFGRRPRAELFVLLLAALSVAGCASIQSWRGIRGAAGSPTEALRAYLNRSEDWQSLGADMRMTIRVQDQSFSARGHILYLINERYEIGFSKPYNRVLGNLYVTPAQIVYWQVNGDPIVFTDADSVMLPELVPLAVPDWDLRDLLPFPISGRSSGLQTDSVWSEKRYDFVRASSGRATHTFKFRNSGILVEERIESAGNEPLIKRYSSVRMIKGWPVAGRVTCRDSAGKTSFTWSLSDISLEAREFQGEQRNSGADSSGRQHEG